MPGESVSNSYVVALEGRLPFVRPLMRGSGEEQPTQDPLDLTVMDELCGGVYLFSADSEAARAIEFSFADDVDREIEADVLERYLRINGGSY
ncbi:hypothetical protein DS901_14725 [Loktanella sp. D2R18]|uniref:hypothetical protein n=1 Tax=Rhodobacterales TaxID=204455 RepID=UPI000DE97608|nr:MULTISPECIES: hypothetical protein [Rhodobacterales]MDO6588777.1 hypothetical protein [Yoonia sp. 1_MG-2023]RBW41993.1 hypothetical protein DS901_14725 [Loktanella sp. D2R18]